MIREVVNRKWVDDEMGLDYTFEPVEGSMITKKAEDGSFIVGYLSRDEHYESPDEWSDDSLFLVNYHGDFEVTHNDIVKKNQISDWYRENIPIAGYWVFPVTMLSHSGVWLKLGTRGFDCDGQGWDTSRVGAVLARKSEFEDQNKAEQAALALIKSWNQCLSGDVYGVIFEFYNAEKKQTNEDSCWGYYGFDYAMAEVANTIERWGVK